MKQNTILDLGVPTPVPEDVLTEILRQGAQKLLAEAIAAEVTEFLARYQALRTAEGQQRVVRNGRLPEREIQTGLGSIPVCVPRVRDRGGKGAGEQIRFTSRSLPPYLRRSKTIDDLLPWLYLKGVSTGDFSEALAVLLGPDAPGVSASTISRLKESWQVDLETWQARDLSTKRYVYFWADGVYFNVRLQEARQCMLVIIGATAEGRKELVAIWDGYRESEQSWKEVLLDLKRRGLKQSPQLAIGDGALGFWKALRQVYGQTRWQRCWVHKTANVLNKLPKGMQPQAKQRLHEIWMAATRQEAEQAFDYFIQAYQAKYPKATECLAKDREELLAFYDFPAEHWKHIRTTNPIESTFATVRLRTAKTRGCLSRITLLTMIFRLCLSAQRRWRRLDGRDRLADIIQGISFVDGLRQERIAA
ncbi:MAG: IS256 family transposase [Anaerolineae bacterium]|nr:IS256 family transposase [Anaerolineae bacterium]